jgi:5-methylcytosine-specific restriction endonuclease McrA
VKLTEGPELDDALELFHNHQWREQKPLISAEQLAELVPVLAPLFHRSRSQVRREPTKQKVANRRPSGTVTSGRVPAKVREAVLARDGYCCQRCGAGLRIAEGDYSLQHRDNRGMGGSKLKHAMANLVALCGSATTGCHGHVESEPLESDRMGWSVPNGVTPEEWPVLRFGRSWEQPGEKRWEKTVPHERQREMWEVA